MTNRDYIIRCAIVVYGGHLGTFSGSVVSASVKLPALIRSCQSGHKNPPPTARTRFGIYTTQSCICAAIYIQSLYTDVTAGVEDVGKRWVQPQLH